MVSEQQHIWASFNLSVKTAMTGGCRGDESSSATSGSIQQMVQPVFASLLYRGDNTSLQFLGHKLNWKSWLKWFQVMKLVIKGRGKLRHMIGTTKKPHEDDLTLQNWDLEDSIIIAWLINSIELKIGQMYLFLCTTKDVWDAVKRTNSDLRNSTHIF